MKDGAWCCQHCRIIHRPEVAAMVLEGLMKGEALEAVWKRLVEEL
jgi:Zn-finger protein